MQYVKQYDQKAALKYLALQMEKIIQAFLIDLLQWLYLKVS
jgi:hypothetical protein